MSTAEGQPNEVASGVGTSDTSLDCPFLLDPHAAMHNHENRLQEIEKRLAVIEEKIVRFEKAMVDAAGTLMGNPIFSSMMPKAMREVLGPLMNKDKTNGQTAKES